MFLHQGYVQRTVHHTALLAELQQRLDVVRAGGGAWCILVHHVTGMNTCLRYPMFDSFDSFDSFDLFADYIRLLCSVLNEAGQPWIQGLPIIFAYF